VAIVGELDDGLSVFARGTVGSMTSEFRAIIQQQWAFPLAGEHVELTARYDSASRPPDPGGAPMGDADAACAV